jgi:hypothetical protein
VGVGGCFVGAATNGGSTNTSTRRLAARPAAVRLSRRACLATIVLSIVGYFFALFT